MAAMRMSTYNPTPALPVPDRRIFSQVLLVAALICTTMGLLHIEPRMADVDRLLTKAHQAGSAVIGRFR